MHLETNKNMIKRKYLTFNRKSPLAFRNRIHRNMTNVRSYNKRVRCRSNIPSITSHTQTNVRIDNRRVRCRSSIPLITLHTHTYTH